MRRGLASITACLLVSGIFSVTTTAGEHVSAQTSAQLLDRWTLPRLPVNEAVDPNGITHLGQEGLLIADAAGESIWSLDPETGDLRPWLQKPSFGMLPFEIRHEPMGDVVFAVSLAGSSSKAGLLPSQYLVLGRDATLFDRWRLQDSDDAWITNGAGVRIAVSPEQVVAWLTNGVTNGEQHSRITTVDRTGQRTLGGRCPEVYDTVAVDALGRYYLKRGLPIDRSLVPGYRIDRADTSGCRQPTKYYQYDGRHPYFGQAISMAGWPSPDRLYVGEELTISAFDPAGRRSSTSFLPGLCGDCEISSLTTRSDNDVAALVRDDYQGTRQITPAPHRMAQVVHFDQDGSPRSRGVFRGPEAPEIVWAAARLSVDADDRVHVLYPDSDLIASFTAAGALEQTLPVASWASDLDAAGALAIKGSSGRVGAVELIELDGRRRWQIPCDCDESSAVAIAGNRIVTGNALAARLESFREQDGGGTALVQHSPSAFWPLDLTASADEVFVLDARSAAIAVFDSQDLIAGPRRTIAVPDDTFRIDAAPDGTLATLTRSGLVSITPPNASSTTAIPLREITGGEDLDASDIAWAMSGDLFLLDAAQPSVLRLRPGEAPLPTPVPTQAVSEDLGECRVIGDKTAQPGRVNIGDEVQVQIKIDIECPTVDRPPLDLLLVLSSVMRGGDGSESRDYHSGMLQAAERLAGALDPARDRIAVMQTWYGQHTGFSSDIDTVRSAIRRAGPYYQPFLPANSASFDGLDWALRLQVSQARPGADRVLVQFLLPGMTRNELDLAERAKSAGVRTILVYRPWNLGISRESDRTSRLGMAPEWASFLPGMVSTPDDLLNLDDVLARDALLDRIAAPYRRGAVRDVEIHDTVGPDTPLVGGSANPPAQESASSVIWRSAAMPAGGLTMTLRVLPTRTGQLPTNTEAVAYFTDPGGTRRRFVFPVPYVEVVAPTATFTRPPSPTATAHPTHTLTASPTATPTLTPRPLRPAYLPIALREQCLPEHRRADVILVLDASTSMLEPPFAGRTKLAAAVDAARVFLDHMRLDLGDQAAIVAFNAEATLLQPLTGDRSVLDTALGRIQAAPQTCLACGMDAALAELQSPRHVAAHNPTVILLTDGRSNPRPASEAVASAAAAKAWGATVFTVGLGADLDAEALVAMASRPAYHYHAPDAEALAGIYRAIAGEIPCPATGFWGRR